MNRRFGLLAAGGLAAALVAGGGTALATTAGPVSAGVITGCYTNAAVNGSHALVLQDAGSTCPKGTAAVAWNEQGSAGPAGPAGSAGATGPAGPPGPAGANGMNGTSIVTSPGVLAGSCNTGDTGIDLADGEVYTCAASNWADTGTSIEGQQGPAGAGATVASLQAGDANCANGGASVSDGNGNTAYACNGATGATGPQGPSGSSNVDAGVLTMRVSFDSSDKLSFTCSLSNTSGPDPVTAAPLFGQVACGIDFGQDRTSSAVIVVGAPPPAYFWFSATVLEVTNPTPQGAPANETLTYTWNYEVIPAS